MSGIADLDQTRGLRGDSLHWPGFWRRRGNGGDGAG